jgi:hypothetical protein
MKWAKTKSACDKIRKRWYDLDKESLAKDMSYYHQIEDGSTLTDLEANGFGIWREFKELKKDYTRSRARARYECFVGGFLYFFEKHVSKVPKDNRVLYIDWGKINKGAALTIFLNPLYDKKKIMPLADSGTDSENSNRKYSLKQNGDNQVLQKALVAPPPDGGEIDPPPPPPPPPPPRDDD